jgi:hypothetical protein
MMRLVALPAVHHLRDYALANTPYLVEVGAVEALAAGEQAALQRP